MVTKKEPIYAKMSCPICDGKLKASGFAWKCTNCSYSQGRAYKRDPRGYDVRDKFDEWGSRLQYRMRHGLPFERGNRVLPYEILYHFEKAREHYYHDANPKALVVCGCTEIGTNGRSSLFVSNPFMTKEECLDQLMQYICVQGDLGTHTKIVDDSNWEGWKK